MANPITHISNFLTLRKLTKTPAEFNPQRLGILMELMQRVYTRKGSFMRNLAAKAIRFQREAYPFQPEDYSEARTMYEEYFKMKNHIPSYTDILEKINEYRAVYIVKFRNEVPVKGERYAQYYINGSYGEKYMQKLTAENIDRVYIQDSLTAYRYATTDEVKQYNTNQKMITALEVLREQKQQEAWDIQSQINELEKYGNKA
jgi:hypothetical protein